MALSAFSLPRRKISNALGFSTVQIDHGTTVVDWFSVPVVWVFPQVRTTVSPTILTVATSWGSELTDDFSGWSEKLQVSLVSLNLINISRGLTLEGKEGRLRAVEWRSSKVIDVGRCWSLCFVFVSVLFSVLRDRMSLVSVSSNVSNDFGTSQTRVWQGSPTPKWLSGWSLRRPPLLIQARVLVGIDCFKHLVYGGFSPSFRRDDSDRVSLFFHLNADVIITKAANSSDTGVLPSPVA